MWLGGVLALAAGSAFSQTCTSTGSANWNTAGTWSCTTGAANHVPLVTDNVQIRNGDTVTINTAAVALNVTVGTGTSGILQFDNVTTQRSLTVGNAGNGNVTVSAGATFRTTTSASLIHRLTLQGNLTNNGTIQFANSATRYVDVIFSGPVGVTQTVSGTGGTSQFHSIGLKRTAVSDIVDVTLGTFILQNGGYVWLQAANGGTFFTGPAVGTFRLSVPTVRTYTPFDSATLAASPDGYIIAPNARFWLNHANATVNYLITATNNNFSLDGELRIDAGTMTVGNQNDERIRLRNFATATFTMNGGTFNTAGRISSVNTTDQGTFTMTGGTINLGTVGNTLATYGPFILGSATTFNWKGGTIVIRKASTAVANEFDVRSSTATVDNSVGTPILRIDSTSAAATVFEISHAATAGLGLWNLEIRGTNTPVATLQSNVVVEGSLTIGASVNGGTLNANNLNIDIGSGNTAGAWTNNAGTFTAGTGTVTFSGSGAQTIAGTTSTPFRNITISKTNVTDTVTISTTPTVGGTVAAPLAGTLTMTSGIIVTGANRVDLTSLGVTAGGSQSSYVKGTMRKNYAASANLSFGTGFPVGDATTSRYAGVNITSGTITAVAGTLDVSTNVGPACSTFGTDHPQICALSASTLIDKADSVNRYWSLVNTGMTIGGGGTYAATFNYNASDRDTGNFASYVAQFCTPSTPGNCTGNWFSTGTNAGGATNTTASAIGGFGDFAVGVLITGQTAVPGAFNIFETSGAAEAPTPANSTIGKIVTKVAGVNFSLDIASINAAKSGYGANINSNHTVDILQVVSNNPGTCPMNAATACRTISAACWNPVQTITASFNPGAVNRGTLPNINISNVYQEVRVRVSGPLGTGCSTDAFAVRPATITVTPGDNDSSTAATAPTSPTRIGTPLTNANAAAGSGVVHRAGRPFSILAQPIVASGSASNYSGSPTIKTGSVTKVLPASGGTLGTFTLGTWAANSTAGTRQTDTASYDSVGAFTLQLEDATWAAVDNVDGSSATTRTIPQTGGTTINVGRFIPDRFGVSMNTPQFRTFGSSSACGRQFTYIGQSFWYGTAPVLTVTAQNAAGVTQANYGDAALFHLTGAMVSQVYSNNAVGPALDTGLIGSFNVVTNNADGTATITVSSAGTEKLLYTRNTTTPANTFTANISLSVTAADTSENAAVSGNGSIATNTSPAVFNGGGTGIAFDLGAGFRYGRLRLNNAVGSERLSLSIPIQTEYWTSNGFTRNAEDTCTVLNPAKTTLSMGNYKGTGTGTALSAANMNVTSNVTLTGANVNVAGYLKLSKPSPIATGSVDLTLDLSVTGEDKTYLRGAWNGTTTYTANPTARASFGMYGAQPREFIYFRENY